MTTQTITGLVNPYWDAVAHLVREDRFYGGPCVDPYPMDAPRRIVDRFDFTGRYAWTITDPESVAFVAEHAGPRVIDPMAGSGYWCSLLAQCGVDALAYDKTPPDRAKNRYHKAGVVHVPVIEGDAPTVVAVHSDRTLLLSWPIYDEPLGVNVLRAYGGPRVIYIGECDGGCCGDDDMFALLRDEWTEVAEHRPVQWWGLHDYITVYDRRGGEPR